MTQRRVLGVIEVDSGTLLIGDPGYVLPNQAGGTTGVDYQAVVDADHVVATRLAGQPVLLIQRFGGDGTYSVVGEFEDDELRRVIVDFEPLDEGDDD